MNAPNILNLRKDVVYPESDGKPLAENTKQLRWITTLYNTLAGHYRNDENIFVGADQLWYPVEGEPSICTAPDVYVVFGRPKGDRGSWKQWEESNTPLTVVFEVLSPSNDPMEMADKLSFYDEYGVEEYYAYDPDRNRLRVHVRGRIALRRVWKLDDFVSPRLGIRFDFSGPEMTVYLPTGEKFLSAEEAKAEQVRNQHLRQEAERRAAEEVERRAEAERRTAEAERRAEAEQHRREDAEQRVVRLVELSRKARHGLASPDEIAELDRLEGESPT